MTGYVPGIAYDFGGGRVYTLAPLPIGTIMRLQQRLAALATDSALTPESMLTILQATHASLKRNHPDITEEAVGELVDVANMMEVIGMVLDVGGFKRKAAADAKNPPAQPLETTSPSTGLPS